VPHVGDVCEIYFHEQAPKKYAICVDQDDLLFLLISTECYNETTDILVDKGEIEWLSHDSYLATGEGHYVYENEIRHVNGQIPACLRGRICEAIEQHGEMPPIQMAPILANLRAIDE